MSKLGSARIAGVLDGAITLSAASLVCAVIVGFSALVRLPVPGTPVPITLQTFALLACAGILQRWYALLMVGWYVWLGAAGAPFFSGGAGVENLFGPTGGYIAGFFIAAAIAGFFGSSAATPARRTLLFVIAACAIYAPGLFVLHGATRLTWSQTLASGLYPFILFDLVKAAAAAGTSAAVAVLLARMRRA